LYNRAEALVFPSLYEGFGLPVLEAMACGCPVICSNVTSLPEVAGKGALFVEPKDEEAIAEAMRRIVADDNLRQSLAQQGVERAWDESGGLDVVINNAGSGYFGPTENFPTEALIDQFQVLVFGQLQLLQLAMRRMRERETGLIINVTSLASRLPVPFMAAY